VSLVLKTTIIAIGVLALLGLLMAQFIGGGKGAESGAAGTGEMGEMSNQERGIPPIDANQPAVTETAAFALG
jgi:hypothetical protein